MTTQRFDRTVVAIGGGDVDYDMLRSLAALRPVVAADGGADIALDAGIMPRLVIGDLDSILDPERFPKENLCFIPDQNSTDLEKTLNLVKAPLFLGLGFLGRRLDHSLASMHALATATSPVLLIGPHDAVIYCRGDFTASLPHQVRISFWPLTRQCFIASHGLRWALDGLTLETGQAIGTSNQTVAEDDNPVAEITIRAGEGQGYFVLVSPQYWQNLADSLGIVP